MSSDSTRAHGVTGSLLDRTVAIVWLAHEEIVVLPLIVSLIFDNEAR
jgi:hypothetical protein